MIINFTWTWKSKWTDSETFLQWSSGITNNNNLLYSVYSIHSIDIYSYSDVNMLTNNIPAIINEYNSMLRPLKIGEPDSLWNLLSIVRDMYRKNDRNALPLLEIITDEMTNCVQVRLLFLSVTISSNVLINWEFFNRLFYGGSRISLDLMATVVIR